jgi:Ca-activated chloride channel family protein
VNLAQKIRAITSPTHSLAPMPAHWFERGNEEQIRISLAGTVAADRDIVLQIEMEKEHAPSVECVNSTNNEKFVAVSFVPEFDIDELGDLAPTETIFLLDCSGSMQGESIQQATFALELCLRSLNAGDRFNIVRFGSTFQSLGSEPLIYSDSSLEQAARYLRMQADLGGTEILAPLQQILSIKPQPGTIRNIIILTDGQVSNEAAVLDLARKHRAYNRIFSFGIGSACSAYLVKGLARATGGAAEFISGKERIEDKVLRTFSRIASPMLTDLHIDWGGAEVQTLAELPPVFDGELMTIFGKIAGNRLLVARARASPRRCRSSHPHHVGPADDPEPRRGQQHHPHRRRIRSHARASVADPVVETIWTALITNDLHRD